MWMNLVIDANKLGFRDVVDKFTSDMIEDCSKCE